MSVVIGREEGWKLSSERRASRRILGTASASLTADLPSFLCSYYNTHITIEPPAGNSAQHISLCAPRATLSIIPHTSLLSNPVSLSVKREAL